MHTTHTLCRLFLWTGAALSLAACSDNGKDTPAQHMVSKRQAIFKQMTKTLEPMGLVARDRAPYNAAEFAAAAVNLQSLSKQPWPLFVADSNNQPTRAKPEVWSQAADFQRAQDNFLGHVSQLVKASEGSDMATLRSATLAVEGSCQSCHDTFRNKR